MHKSRIHWVAVSRARLCCIGHVLCKEDNRLPKSVLYGEMLDGRKDSASVLRMSCMKTLNQQWEQLASNRTEWRLVIYTYEGRVPTRRSNNRNNMGYECRDCGRRITSRIGMYSHRWVYQNRNAFITPDWGDWTTKLCIYAWLIVCLDTSRQLLT